MTAEEKKYDFYILELFFSYLQRFKYSESIACKFSQKNTVF